MPNKVDHLTSLLIKSISFFIKSLILTFLFSHNIQARVHDFESTRLKSTAGAGVASVLMDESVLLNPASIAFFDVTSIYIQRINSSFNELNKSGSQSEGPQKQKEESKSHGIILADGKGMFKGAISHQLQDEMSDHRQRFALSGSHAIGKMSSFGILYRWTQDNTKISAEDGSINANKKSYHQINLGVIHAINENLTLGATVNDIFRKEKEDVKFTLGVQFLYMNIISLMADAGGNYYEDPAPSFFHRLALQLNFFDDFYLRVGTFRDKGLNEKGNGLGIGWLSPRMLIDLAVKNTQLLSSQLKQKDLSLSLSFRF
jgi:hypothetical protein